MNAPLLTKKSTSTVGEGRVWLVASGLTAGLAMVVLLLGTVLFHSLPVFWPKRIQVFDIGGEPLAGMVIEERAKTGGGRESLLYTGNRDAFGLAFRWVDNAAIAGASTPKDLLLLERVENGNALIRPVAFVAEDGTRVLADAPEFRSALDAAIDRVADLRRRIRRIEVDEVGDNADSIEELKLELEVGRARKTLGTAEEAEVEAKITALETRFAELDKKRGDLRGQIDAAQLEVEILGKDSRSISVGSVLDAYAPNELGLFGRFGRFVHNMIAFVWENPRESNTEGGVFPAIIGTFVMTLLMSAAVMPLGVVAAIYLREYAKQGPLVRGVRIAINNLAGVPSIVFGVFGLGFFVYFLGDHIDHWFYADRLEFRKAPTFGTGGILWAALTLALMTVPVVIVATEEAISAVTRGVREGSLALGASKWQTIQRIVLPGAVPGILTGLILAMARGAGEVAPLMMVGVIKLVKDLPVSGDFPFVHPSNKFMHLGFHIYDLGFQSPDSDAARPMVFATTLLLIGLVLFLNLTAILLRERIRRRMVSAAF